MVRVMVSIRGWGGVGASSSVRVRVGVFERASVRIRAMVSV
jgi:hypothetical protein